MLTRVGVWLGLLLVLAGAVACAGGAPGGAIDDDGGGLVDAGGADGANGPGDAAPVQVPPGAGITLCGAGGAAQAGTVRSYTCLAPVDLAVGSSTNEGVKWQPGPIYRVAP